MTRVLVAGALANKPLNGGEAWVRMSWVDGLRRLGCDVFFVEQIEDAIFTDAHGARTSFERSVNRGHFEQVVKNFGLVDKAALVLSDGPRAWGIAYPDVLEMAAAADLLVNISGNLSLKPILDRITSKAYVDLDPGFTQIWHAEGRLDRSFDDHDFFFTVGASIGSPGCPVPTNGVPWRPIRPHVVLSEWPLIDGRGGDAFTTVATWRGPYGPVEYAGRTFGVKVHEFRRFVAIPSRVSQRFEIALEIDPADEGDLVLLREHGWEVKSARDTVPDPEAFRRYVQHSAAEFSVAQGMYVDTQCGWFSDRSVRYLASGRPVVVQDTGFSQSLPVGEGLLAFRTMDEAVAAVTKVAEDYESHRRAARQIAEEFFDSTKVLGTLLEEVGLSP